MNHLDEEPASPDQGSNATPPVPALSAEQFAQFLSAIVTNLAANQQATQSQLIALTQRR